MWKKQTYKSSGKIYPLGLKAIFHVAIITASLFLITKSAYAISFSISNPNSDGEQVTFDVSISDLTSSSCPNTNCYLQAAFSKSGTNSNYFGLTKGQNDWFKYVTQSNLNTSDIQSTFFAFQPTSGSWSGQVTLKVDPNDSGYNGPGTYDIKAWRYTGNSTSGSASDNTISADLNHSISTPTPEPTSDPGSTPTPTPSSTPKATPTPSPKATPKSSPTATKSASPSASPQVLGEQNRSLIASDAGLLDAGSPASTAFQGAPSKKVAGILIVSGATLVLFALGFHLWYRKINKGKLLETKDPFQL